MAGSIVTQRDLAFVLEAVQQSLSAIQARSGVAHFRVGSAAAVEAFNSGDFTPVARIFADARSSDDRIRAVGYHATRGAMTTFAGILDSAKLKGVTFSTNPPSVSNLAYAEAIGAAEYSAAAQIVMNAVQAFKAARPMWVASFANPAPAPATAASTPHDVRVVSMPDHEVVQEVVRDESGEIVRTISRHRSMSPGV